MAVTLGSSFEIVINNEDLISMKRALLAAENVSRSYFHRYMPDFMYLN